MRPATETAYRAWRRAADTPYSNRPRYATPAAMERLDARIRRLKARYEELLREEKERPA